MLLIPCPWCGERHQSEFTYGGEAHIERPREPDGLSDEAWAGYLFTRSNPKGWHRERWHHSLGCRRWFNALRHTLSDELVAVYKVGETPPALPDGPNDAGPEQKQAPASEGEERA